MKKIFRCCICHKVLEDYKPIRLVKQVHDEIVPYGAYHYEDKYDFCKKCYKIFERWLEKHEVQNEEGKK